MSVTNYIPDSCKYSIGKLMKSVYLISEDAVKDIRIDNGDAYINSVSESPINIDCYSINLQEEESLDERYKFTHTLTFSVNGYANSDDFQGRFYAIVKDNEGTYWLVNPLFPCKVTYTYTLGYNQSHTDFTMATVSNHPVLRLHNFGDATPYECQEYFLDGIDALWLNEKRYTVHDGSSVKYTNDGFKTIEYNQRTATFTETFDGTNTSHQIDFDILFSQYKSSWHYNLLEFKDNLYSAVFKTTNGKYALCGFSFGLQPSFKINADDTIQGADRIQITLQDAHDVGDTIEFFDSIDYEYLSTKTYEYTSEYDGYECVGNGIAKYLLQKEVDALGNETGNYKALEGYENDFQELNIVDTFDNVVTFARSECSVEPCRLSTSLPNRIKFTSVGSKIYTLRAGSNWTITHDQGISVSPDSGSANIDYTITVYNGHTPTSEAWLTNLKVTYCDGMEHNSVIEVVVDEDACFENGSTYNISANEQTLTIPTQCCIQSVKERTGVGTISNVYSTYITVYVPVNNSGINRTAILLVELCDGSATNITINQSNLFESWVDDHTICIGRSKYMVQYKYTGTSPDHCDTRTDETRTVLVDVTSDDCIYEYRWVLSDQTDCVEYDEYYLYQRQVRIIDGVDPWENVTPAEYSIDGYGTMERVLFKKKSVNCGWVNYAMYRWVDTDDGECFEVKECEDYDQLNVPVCIRDGVIVDNKMSSVLNVPSTTTGRATSNVAEVLVGKDIQNDIPGATINALTTGVTVSNLVSSLSSVSARYQYLVGCGVESFIPITQTQTLSPQYYEPFVYLLKDSPLGLGYHDNLTVYVPDWSVTSHRKSYFSGTGACDTNIISAMVLPITDNPVPILLTEYKFTGTTYECVGGDKYEVGNVMSGGTVIGTGRTLYEADSPDCASEDTYLTFEAIDTGTFHFSGDTMSYGHSIYYSLDGGETWTYLTNDTNTPTVQAGNKIIWKGNGARGNNGIGQFSSSGRFNASGNIMSLVYGDDYSGKTTVRNYEFKYLFASSKIVSAEDLLLPATTLGQYCYQSMFSSCWSLTTPPKILPATTLEWGCYESMFKYCGSLTASPELPNATMAMLCYYEMFYGCSSLNNVTCLVTSIPAAECTENWLGGVAANGTFTKAANMSSWTTGDSGIPSGWTIISV